MARRIIQDSRITKKATQRKAMARKSIQNPLMFITVIPRKAMHKEPMKKRIMEKIGSWKKQIAALYHRKQ